jgi:hypothetical protein
MESEEENEGNKLGKKCVSEEKEMMEIECSETIKLLKEMDIDDLKRTNCKMREVRSLEEWRKWALQLH